MTTIQNDNFTVKKAPAKKTPAKKGVDLLMKAKRQAEESRLENIKEYNKLTDEEKKAKYGLNSPSLDAQAIREELEAEARLDVEGTTLEHAEKLHDINNAVTTLQRNADAQKQLINSVNDKNQALQDKLNIVDADNIKVIIPRGTIEKVITEAIMKVNTQLADSVDEVNEVIEKLYQDDIQEALKDMARVNDLKNRVCTLEEEEGLNDIEYRVDDLEYKIEDVVTERTVETMVEDYVADEGFASSDDVNNDFQAIDQQLTELQSKVDSLTRNKLMYRVKSLFNRIISKLSLKRLLSPRK